MDLSFLICTRNGAETIAEAIACIGRQINVGDISFEIVVIDNGSTDDTLGRAASALAALQCPSVLLREAREGKVSAFLRGVAVSAAPLIAIIDDDNQVGDEFLSRTVAMLRDFPQVGVVGSVNTILADSIPPWFKRGAEGFFACDRPRLDGNIEHIDDYRTIARGGVIAGAGMTFRKEPLLEALSRGFTFTNDALRGVKLAGGEDLELCLLLTHYGYWLGADTRITLRHRIQPSRLSWTYARRLFRSNGAAAVVFDSYSLLDNGLGNSTLGRFRATWAWMMARRLRRLLKVLPAAAGALVTGRTMDPIWMTWDVNWGAMEYLLHERGRHNRKIQAVLHSDWGKFRRPDRGAK